MKKHIMKVFIFLIIIGSIYCLYTKYNKYQMLKEMDDSVPIVFAAELEGGNKGTFKYNIKTGEYEKISDYIFQELSYSDDYEKIIGVIWEDRFQGIAELDMRDNKFKPIIELKFSPDGKYMFYTVGDNPFFGGSFYRRTFYLADIESGNKIKLIKWKEEDIFYGIDW